MEVFSVPVGERQKRQHFRIGRMALFERIRFPVRCVWGAGLQRQLVDIALCSQFQIAFKKQHIRKVTEIRYTTCTPPTLIPDGGTLCERKP